MESVLKEAGSCGPYQVVHVTFTQLPRVVALLSTFFMMFGGYDPGWSCIKTDYGNDTISSNSSVSMLGVSWLNIKDNTSRFERRTDNTSVPNMQVNSGKCDLITICQKIQFKHGSETIVTEFQLVCSRSWIIRAILFVTSVGGLLGPFAGSQLGEKFGRRVPLYACTAVISLANVIAIFSKDWKLFASCYFFIGAAGNTILGTSSVFTLEFLTAKWRGYYGSIPISSLSFCLFVFLTTLLKDWVHVHVAIICLSLVACVGVFIIPESPRWLVMNGYPNKAKESVRRIAKLNKVKLKEDTDLFMNVEHGTGKNKTYSIIDMMRNREARVIALKFALIYFVNCTTFQSITFGIKSLPGDYYYNAIEASCAEAIIVFSVGHLCNLIGRRYSGFLFASLGAISSLAFVLTLSFAGTGNTSDIFLKIFTYLARSSSECMLVVSGIFSAELIPTVVRNVATGLFRSCGGMGGLVMPFLTPGKDVTSLIISFSIICVLYCINAVLFPLFPETNRRHLTDSLRIQKAGGNDNDEHDNDADDN